VAKCDDCGQEMLDGVGCTYSLISKGKKAKKFERIPYRTDWEGNCHDCGCPPGTVHHCGCDMETCPDCGGQMISCGCKWKLVWDPWG
jgi:hypothetical protein